jgi:hypothetical protein
VGERRFQANSETYLLNIIERAVLSATICLGPTTTHNIATYMVQLMYRDGGAETVVAPKRRHALEQAAERCEDRLWLEAARVGVKRAEWTGDGPDTTETEREAA